MNDRKKKITATLNYFKRKVSVRIAPAFNSPNEPFKKITSWPFRKRGYDKRGYVKQDYEYSEEREPFLDLDNEYSHNYKYSPSGFTPKIPIEIWGKIFCFLEITDLYTLSHVNKSFRTFCQSRSLFQQTIQAYSYDDVNPFPHPKDIPLEMHGPLAVALHNREMNWRSGKVNSITLLKGHMTNNIGLMALAGPWFVATFTDEETLRIWDMRTPGKGRILTVLHGAEFTFMKIVLERNELVAAIKDEHVVKIYDLKTGYVLRTFLTWSQEPITALAAVGNAIAAGFRSGKIILWNNGSSMEYKSKERLTVVGLQIYGSYVLSITASGIIRVHTTEGELSIIQCFNLPSFTTTLHIVEYVRFAAAKPLSVLMTTYEQPTKFRQDIKYNIYHITWNGDDEDAPLHQPNIRYWDSEFPGHRVRWEEFDHVSKGRAIVGEMETSMMTPHMLIVWPREHKLVNTFWSDNPRVMTLLKGMGARDGWVPRFGIDDEKIILTGRWKEFYALDFGSKQLQRMRAALQDRKVLEQQK